MQIVCDFNNKFYIFPSIRVENIFDKTKLVEDEKIKHVIIKEHDSEDYREMIACLKKHQLAIQFVLWKISS